MNTYIAVLLGVVQGLTEFLPISSSGHLVIVQSLLPNFSQPGVLFDVVLHFGTTVAVILYFYKTIIKITRKYLLLLVVGSIPVAFVGYFLKDLIELFFGSTLVVGAALMVTAAINFLIDKSKGRSAKISYLDSLLVGLAQTIAIIPGISRSGSTIFAATKLGISKRKAAEFSFLLSIPAIIGANFLEFTSNYSLNNISQGNYIVGFVAAFISGLVAINLVFRLLESNNLKYFGYYCFIVGILLIILNLK